MNDLYSKLSTEFSIPRTTIKNICFGIVYSTDAKTPKEQEQACRQACENYYKIRQINEGK